MGKLVVTEFMSVDGVFQDPGGSGEMERGAWSFEFDRGTDGDRFKLDELVDADVQLLGRVTYDGFAAVWPNVQDEQGFAEKMNGMPKYVASTTLADPSWQNTTVIFGDVAEAVARLKDEVEGDILVAGSGKLVHTLLEHDLVDELHLMVFPIIVGQGRHMFGELSKPTTLKLAESRTVGGDGVIVLTYTRAS